MRKFLIGLAAASIAIAVSAADASAQVTGIRHTDGSWTYVDANGRDIHAAYYATGAAQHDKYRIHHDVVNERSRSSQQYGRGHKTGSPQ